MGDSYPNVESPLPMTPTKLKENQCDLKNDE